MLGIAIVLAAVCGLLYFFIAPILGLMWTLLHMNEALFQPVKYGLLIVAYVAAFLWFQGTGTCSGASISPWGLPRSFFTSPRKPEFSASL